MKNKVLVAILILLFFTIMVARKDERMADALLMLVNPIKQTYVNITKEVEDKGQSFLYQKEHIEKLSSENKFLRKYLLEQKQYVQQVKDLYRVIPSIERVPPDSVQIVQTISYVKLNSFSQVILTKPLTLDDDEEKIYGLIQGSVVAGVAQVKNNNLYATFTSNKKCRFSVFVGEKRVPGIAFGVKGNKMVVKFIPKWSEIKAGDIVRTNGLDDIFFANVPVGIVESIEVESSYKVAHIKSYADILHPDYFYLITDASALLLSNFDGKVLIEQNKTIQPTDQNQTLDLTNDLNISSIPSLLIDDSEKITQTDDQEVTEDQLEIPDEVANREKKLATEKKKKKIRKRKVQPKIENLEMF